MDLIQERKTYVDRYGSPDYSWTVPALAAGAKATIELFRQFPDSKKYGPCDFVEVVNADVVNLTLFINEDNLQPVPAGTVRVRNVDGIRQIGIRNDDAAVAITLGSVIVTLRRNPIDADKKARGY